MFLASASFGPITGDKPLTGRKSDGRRRRKKPQQQRRRRRPFPRVINETQVDTTRRRQRYLPSLLAQPRHLCLSLSPPFPVSLFLCAYCSVQCTRPTTTTTTTCTGSRVEAPPWYRWSSTDRPTELVVVVVVVCVCRRGKREEKTHLVLVYSAFIPPPPSKRSARHPRILLLFMYSFTLLFPFGPDCRFSFSLSPLLPPSLAMRDR